MKSFRKGMAILLCALLLFPMFNMTSVKATDLTETEPQVQNEMEGQEETPEKTVSSETAEIPSITLHAGAGTLEGNTTVTLSDDKLPGICCGPLFRQQDTPFGIMLIRSINA